MITHIRTAIIRVSIILLAGLCMNATPSTAQAQRAVQGYGGRGPQRATAVPYQQRLSPYLDLLRSDNSVLSPYHSFVQPRQQSRQNQNRQAAELRRLERTIGRPGTTASQPERMQTGRGGTFNNYLHFYPFNSATNR